MAKQTVDEFIIELGFTENVLKGLAKVEKQVLPIAKRIEDRLNKAFNTNGSQQMSKTFNRIVKDAESAGRKINKALTNAFDIKNAGRSSMRGFENQSNAMARRIAKEIQKAYNVRGNLPPLPPLRRRPPRGEDDGGRPSPRPGSGGGRNNTSNWIESHVIRNSDNGMTNTMASLGMVQQRAAMRAELRALADRHKMDATTHEYERAARQVIFGYKQQIAQMRAANRQAERNAFMQHSLENSTVNLVKGFVSVYAALDWFKDSLQEGAKRTQAHTMAVTAYNTEAEATRMTLKADEISNNYGLDTLTTRQQMAQMRMTMPATFSNDKIAQLFENESIFAHTTGMSQEAVGRLNYAMQQIAASAHLMGQDWMQVVNASPALVTKMVQQLGAKDSRDLREKAKSMSGAQFVEEMMKAMVPTERQRKMAMENIIAAQGRLNNAIKAGQNSMFVGMEKGVRELMEAFTNLLLDSSGNFENLGDLIGYVAEKLTPVVKFLDEMFMNIDGYLGLFKEKIDELRKSSPVWDQIFRAFDSVAGAAIDWIAVIAALKLLSSFAGILTKLLGVKALLGAATGTAGAGAAGLGATGAAAGAGLAVRLIGIAQGLVLPVLLAQGVLDLMSEKLQYKKGDSENTHNAKAWGTMIWGIMSGAINPFDSKDDKKPVKPMEQGYGTPAYLQMTKPYQFAPMQVQVEVVNRGEIDVKMPDGTVQRMALEAAQQQHEFQMMSAQGLQGGWQSHGQNAGFTPSSLMRK